MAGVDHFLVYMQTAVKYRILYIHQEMVYTSHFLIFSRPKPGGGVYFWGPHKWYTHVQKQTSGIYLLIIWFSIDFNQKPFKWSGTCVNASAVVFASNFYVEMDKFIGQSIWSKH